MEYCDRSVSMHEAAWRAVEKIQGSADSAGAEPSTMRQTAAGDRRDRHLMSILIDADTTFIVQGITGREAVNSPANAWTTARGQGRGRRHPGRKGRDVHGVPVFDTVAQAVEHHGALIDGLRVTVPPAFTKDAVFEAIENGVKLIVIVTERIPRGDVAQMVSLAAARGARIIGPELPRDHRS